MDNLISVIMSVRDGQDTVQSAIESILNQSYKNFELLVLDDFSSDNTYKLISQFTTDNRVKVYRNDKNIGLTKSLNILAKKSKGKYLARQDADDVSLENRFEKQLNFMLSNNIEVSTTKTYINFKGGNIKPRFLYKLPNKIALKIRNPFIHGTLMIKKDSFFSINGYDEDFIFSQDYKLYSDLVKSDIKIKTLNEPLYILNTFNNLSSKYKDDQNMYMKEVRKNIKLF